MENLFYFAKGKWGESLNGTIPIVQDVHTDKHYMRKEYNKDVLHDLYLMQLWCIEEVEVRITTDNWLIHYSLGTLCIECFAAFFEVCKPVCIEDLFGLVKTYGKSPCINYLSLEHTI